jgi:glycosyltransferase involved in cell wall biosynthesis
MAASCGFARHNHKFRFMKIAMIVHNGVVRDARVLKEARSLLAAGHQVEVHGIGEPLAESPEAFPIILSQPDGPIAALRAFWQGKGPLATLLAMLGERPGRHVQPVMAILLGGIVAALFAVAVHIARQTAGLIIDLSLLVLAAAVIVGAVVSQSFRLRLKRLWATAAVTLLRVVEVPAAALKKVVLYGIRLEVRLIGLGVRLYKAIGGLRGTARLYHMRYQSISTALVKSVARRGRPDVIHIHDHVALTGAAELRRLFGCPIVWDAHEIYEDLAALDPARGAMNAALITQGHRFADHFITINESIAAFYAKKYRRLRNATVVMNATEVMPVPVDDGRMHRACGLPPSQKILLFQGGFGPKRGLPQLVEASAMLNDDWTLVLMGWGKLEAELRDIAAAHARPDRALPSVVFLPGVPQRELQQWSAGASLGAIPYENTGLNHLYCTPNKLWEYPNAGVPILATGLVEMTRVIEGGGTGFLLPREFTAADIAETVNRLTPEQLEAARAACLAFIERDNWSLYESRLVALYDRIGEQVYARRAAPVPEVGQAAETAAAPAAS